MNATFVLVRLLVLCVVSALLLFLYSEFPIRNKELFSKETSVYVSVIVYIPNIGKY